jgi:hypothetical protein
VTHAHTLYRSSRTLRCHTTPQLLGPDPRLRLWDPPCRKRCRPSKDSTKLTSLPALNVSVELSGNARHMHNSTVFAVSIVSAFLPQGLISNTRTVLQVQQFLHFSLTDCVRKFCCEMSCKIVTHPAPFTTTIRSIA